MYVEREDHWQCFVPGCKRPRKLSLKGRYAGRYVQTCLQCAGDRNKRIKASKAVKGWVAEKNSNSQVAVVKRVPYSRAKIDPAKARAIYDAAAWIWSAGLGTHDSLVAKAFGISEYIAMRMRLTPERWGVNMPPIKIRGGTRSRPGPAETAKAKQYLEEIQRQKGRVEAPPVEPKKCNCSHGSSTDGEQDVDAAFRVIAQAIKSRDQRIEDLETENDLLRTSQTNQIYNRIADKLLRRFGNQLKNKEGDELRESLERIMKETPAEGRTKE